MKRIITVLAVLVVLFVGAIALFSCKNKKSDSKDTVYTIKLSHYNSPGEPNDISANKWRDLVEQKSNGRVIFEVYPASQLGSQKDVMEQIRLGSNVISISDAGFLMDYVKDIGILYAPYLTDSYESYFKVIDSDWFRNISKEVATNGFEIVAAKWVYGTRHLLANKPVRNPADFKGLKIRTPNMKLLTDAINAMGGIATPMPLSEVYPALSQGVIDGAENPIAVLYGAKLQEQAKYLSLTKHVFNVSIWIGSATYFNSLPDDVVQVIKDAGEEASLFQYEQSKRSDEEYLAKMRSEGVEVITPDIEAFRAATQKVYDNFSPSVVQEVKSLLK